MENANTGGVTALREIEEEDRLWNTRLADQDAELRELEEAENKGEKKKKKRYQGPKKDNKPGDEAAKPKKRTAKDYEIL